MEIEQKEDSSSTLAYGSANSGKRGRGRPRGSVKKKNISEKEIFYAQQARTSKQVDFFSPEMVRRPKVKKRGRPKKIRIPGRPRKIPLTPEEEAERILRLNKKRKFSKPLGRPRIHPLVDRPKEKRGRGRPRKYESITSQNGRIEGSLKSVTITEVSEDSPRRRGRPRGTFKKKRGPPGSGIKLQVNQDPNGTPRKRGRPPGSGMKLKIITSETNGTPKRRGRPPGSSTTIKVVKQMTDGIPRKRGRPPGSGTKVKHLLETNGSPRKRGRPSGSGKIKAVTEYVLTNSSFSETQPRKRGRPKKSAAFLAVKLGEGMCKENNEPFSKRPRISLVSTKNSSNPDDQKASEIDGCHVATTVENPVLSAGGFIKPDRIEEVGGDDDALIGAIHESNIRKSSSSRVAGKSQKKK